MGKQKIGINIYVDCTVGPEKFVANKKSQYFARRRLVVAAIGCLALAAVAGLVIAASCTGWPCILAKNKLIVNLPVGVAGLAALTGAAYFVYRWQSIEIIRHVTLQFADKVYNPCGVVFVSGQSNGEKGCQGLIVGHAGNVPIGHIGFDASAWTVESASEIKSQDRRVCGIKATAFNRHTGKIYTFELHKDLQGKEARPGPRTVIADLATRSIHTGKKFVRNELFKNYLAY